MKNLGKFVPKSELENGNIRLKGLYSHSSIVEDDS